MKRLAVAMVSLITASSALAQGDGVPPGPPAVEVSGVVDVNVTNEPEDAVPVQVTNAVPVELNESLDENVVLHFRFDSDNLCGPSLSSQGIAHLEFSDRTVDSLPFVVPAGKALKITHLNWHAFGSPSEPWSAGEFLEVTVGINSGQFLLTTGTVISSELAAAQHYAGNLNIHEGLVFRSGESVCLFSTFSSGTTGTSGPSLNGTKLHGRLVEQ